jgi:spermidine synthase
MELDAAKISARFQQDSVRSTLQDVGISSAAALLATWVTDRAGLERFAADTPPVTDDQPRIEYAPWVRDREITRVLPALLDLRSAPPLVNADAGFIASAPLTAIVGTTLIPTNKKRMVAW